MNNYVIVVPTYWSREKPQPDDLVYDHPTPLNEEGTLKRLLESLPILKNREVETVIISCPTFADTDSQVKKKVDSILRPFQNDYKIYHFSYQSLLKFQDIFEKHGKPEFKSCLSLFGYSNVRNCCIYLPNILNKDIAILIDDDEVFEDPLFLQKATEFISPEKPAIAGYYVQAHGGYKFTGKIPWYRSFWNNADAMNEAFGLIDSGERLKDTPFVFGGNMIIHRTLFMKVPFDPYIRRGEDISYLCDTKNHGLPFLLDRQLSIKHLPPKGTMPEYLKIREDLYRFIYMRIKLVKQRFDLARTMPYPGCFLQEDLAIKIAFTSLLYSLNSLLSFKIRDALEFLINITSILEARLKAVEWFEKFEKLQKIWPEFMAWSLKNRAELVQVL